MNLTSPPRELVIKVNMGNWWAMVHYADCPMVNSRLAYPRYIPIPARMPVRLGKCCNPAPHDVYRSPPHVEWYEHSPMEKAPPIKVIHMDMGHVDNILGRRSLGVNRIPPRSTGLEP